MQTESKKELLPNLHFAFCTWAIIMVNSEFEEVQGPLSPALRVEEETGWLHIKSILYYSKNRAIVTQGNEKGIGLV